jgi:hypothetical protein
MAIEQQAARLAGMATRLRLQANRNADEIEGLIVEIYKVIARCERLEAERNHKRTLRSGAVYTEPAT